MAAVPYPNQYHYGHPYRGPIRGPPPGWRPPFSGAPPIPPSITVNPQSWQTGAWHFNPAYNVVQGQAPVQWVPAQAWNQPGAASYNPNKRTVKPPSAEYLNSKLSDNPLGLTNMIPAEQLRLEAAAEPQTPWIWMPAGLAGEDSPDSDHGDRRRQGSHDSVSRQPSFDRHADPSAASRHRRRPSSQPHTPESPQTPRTTPRGSPPQSAPPVQRKYDASDYIDGIARAVHVSNYRQYPNEPPRAETFTAKRDLQPTFSTNIVRTPDHYRGPSRSASRSSIDSSVDAQLAAKLERQSSIYSKSPTPTPLTRHLSDSQAIPPLTMPSSSMSGVPLVDEPSTILSPLVLTTPGPSTLPLGRQSSAPVISNYLSTIPEGPSIHKPSSRKTTPAVIHSSSTPSLHHPNHPHSRNPLPRPPMDIYAIPQPHFDPVPALLKNGVRRGFWNRRGDHLTPSGHIVYAPPDRANPEELKDYPAETEGYRDSKGVFARYVDRPELPESLPRHGHPPQRPYEHFIIYDPRT